MDDALNWLQNTQFADWKITPMTGDASSRSYARLTNKSGNSAILMHDPGGAQALAQFTKISEALTERGLVTPRRLEINAAAGLAIWEDLGPLTLAAAITSGAVSETRAYADSARLLAKLSAFPAPENLTPLTPQEGAALLEPLGTHYAPETEITPIKDALENTLNRLPETPLVLAHRDFHAENMIWRPDAPEGAQIGLLDFQDAVSAPPAYDLASLVRDCRRHVSKEAEAAAIEAFCKETGTSEKSLQPAVAAWGVARNLRILGVFARLASDYGKLAYSDLLPRVWNHVQNDLKHPTLAELRTACAPLPAPEERA